MNEEEKKITFKELVETRREEMKSMLPGLMTIVRIGEYQTEVYSPNSFERSTFKR